MAYGSPELGCSKDLAIPIKSSPASVPEACLRERFGRKLLFELDRSVVIKIMLSIVS